MNGVLTDLYLSVDPRALLATLGALYLCWWVYRVDRVPNVLPAPRMDTIARGPLESWRVSAGRVRIP